MAFLIDQIWLEAAGVLASHWAGRAHYLGLLVALACSTDHGLILHSNHSLAHPDQDRFITSR